MSKHKKKRTGSLGLWLILVGSISISSVLLVLFAQGREIPLLDPKGYIANEQHRLFVTSTTIMVIFALLVLFFLYFFTWRYRETNHKSSHDPKAGRSKLLVFTAWASPIFVFIVLAAMMLPATQKLEPQRSIKSDTNEITIQVVAMRWKWLFLYPEQDIATVNYVQIPVDTPVRFELTADEAPMQSFWIPHLGGMLYAMTEHVNPLNLMADTVGEYNGGAAEINGHGFAGMRFKTHVSSKEDFESWTQEVATSSQVFDSTEYQRLLIPSEYDEPLTYHSPNNEELFGALVAKYAGSHNHYDSEEATSGGHRH